MARWQEACKAPALMADDRCVLTALSSSVQNKEVKGPAPLLATTVLAQCALTAALLFVPKAA